MHALFLRKLRRKQLSGKRILWGYLSLRPGYGPSASAVILA